MTDDLLAMPVLLGEALDLQASANRAVARAEAGELAWPLAIAEAKSAAASWVALGNAVAAQRRRAHQSASSATRTAAYTALRGGNRP